MNNLDKLVEAQIQSLIDSANATTGNTDTNLTDGVNALIGGYGQGGLSEIDFIRAISKGILAYVGSGYTKETFIFNRFPLGTYWVILWGDAAKPCLTIYNSGGKLLRGDLNMRLVTHNMGSSGHMRIGVYDKFSFDKAYPTSSYSRQHFGSKSARLTIDNALEYMHPAVTKYFTYGVENPMEEVLGKIKFRDLFTLSNYGDDFVHVMIFAWSDSVFCAFFKSEAVPYLDYENGKLCLGAGIKGSYIADQLTTYANRLTTVDSTLCDKVGIELYDYTSQQSWSGSWSTFIEDIPGQVYFNSFDLKDENGNVLVEANCTIDDFIE